jgi:hypothetical protein
MYMFWYILVEWAGASGFLTLSTGSTAAAASGLVVIATAAGTTSGSIRFVAVADTVADVIFVSLWWV